MKQFLSMITLRNGTPQLGAIMKKMATRAIGYATQELSHSLSEPLVPASSRRLARGSASKAVIPRPARKLCARRRVLPPWLLSVIVRKINLRRLIMRRPSVRSQIWLQSLPRPMDKSSRVCMITRWTRRRGKRWRYGRLSKWINKYPIRLLKPSSRRARLGRLIEWTEKNFHSKSITMVIFMMCAKLMNCQWLSCVRASRLVTRE